MKKRYILCALLLIWGGIILFLSFQNGTDTATTSGRLTMWLMRLCGADSNDWNLRMMWDHRLRVAAHAIVFYIYGMFGAFVLQEQFQRQWLWRVVFVISGIGLAVWSEAGKVWMGIPGRHCDMGEMMLNLLGFAVGFLINLGLEAWMRWRKR